MKVIKYLILSFLPVLTTNAQNIMTSSPYSMFGLGEIVTGLYVPILPWEAYRPVCAIHG